MVKCDFCRGQIADDEPNLGEDGRDVCYWCEGEYLQQLEREREDGVC